jgi:hypothetical protein
MRFTYGSLFPKYSCNFFDLDFVNYLQTIPMQKILTALILLIGYFLACTPKLNPYGMYKKIDDESVYKLKRDTTTRAEVESYFGKPQRSAFSEEGYQYTYSYFGDTLFLQFKNNNTLSTFKYEPEFFTPDFEDLRYTKRTFPNRVLKRIIRGETKLPQLTTMFGKPNRGEKGKTRYRTTFIGTTQELIVYSSLSDYTVIDFQVVNR